MHHLTTRLGTAIALSVLAVGCGSSAITSSTPAPTAQPSAVPTTSAPTVPVTTSPTSTGPTTGPSDSPTTLADRRTMPRGGGTTLAPSGPVPAELLGRFWRADSNITVGGLRTLPSGTGAGFTITADGTIAVNTGCNTGTGHATFENGTQMVVGPLAVTKRACPASAGDTETTMLFILGERNSFFVEGDTLTLTPLGITDVGLRLIAGA